MATRAEYAQCVGQGMKGKHLTKDERYLEFCVVSKLCSKKASNRDDAIKICSQPKAPKMHRVPRDGRRKGVSCEKASFKTAECVVQVLTESNIYRDQALNINSVGSAIANALIQCECGSK